MGNIKITIDNKELQIESGKTLLEAAKEAHIPIPTLCHINGISHNTSCFVCVVKDKKTNRFIPSCTALVAEGMDIDASSPEVFDMRQTALNLILSEHSGDCEAPCTIACPAHANVEEYIREGKKGNFLESLKIIKERIPLPISIGRVCPRFCEKDCRRNSKDSAVAINDFKRLAADLFYESYMEDLPELGDKKVAIIGAGPAGLAIAYFLRLNGVSSDIFEQKSKAGGMLRYGIPQYRLPKELLDKEINHFYKMGGINIHFNKKVGKDISFEELKNSYNAVAVTVGSWKASPMRVEGEEFAFSGIKWLEEISESGWSGKNPGKTVVVGGGNTAMDCVRTAVRLGSSEVYCFYRRTEDEMPAEKIEIEEAKEEGVNFQFLVAPLKIREENGRKILTCLRMELGEPDASGRRRPVEIPNSEFDVEADTIIAAIGQKTDAKFGVTLNKWGDVSIKKSNFQVETVENDQNSAVFSAGDCTNGPATVVEAVAQGRVAAMGILSYFKGEEYKEPYLLEVTRGHWNHLTPKSLVFLKTPSENKRVKQRLISLEDRKTTFNEVSLTFTKEEIAQEGERCFECSCTAKKECSLKQHSETYRAQFKKIKGRNSVIDYDTRHPKIILDRGKCIKCGICVKTCSEVINQSLLGFKNRGYSTIIDTAFSAVLPNSCSDCGECIKNCPTGALDWKIK